MHRVDTQLQKLQRRPALARVGESVAPARYIILTMAPDGTVRAVSGDDPDPAPALARVRAMGPQTLRAEAASGQVFAMGPMHAVAKTGVRGRVTVVVAPLGDIRASLVWLIITELLTSAVIVGVLAMLGRWLIGRGLAPLSRMATTAHTIASGGDLRSRMEESESEVGRLAGAINVMLDRIEQAFVARVRSEAKVREFAHPCSDAQVVQPLLRRADSAAETFARGAEVGGTGALEAKDRLLEIPDREDRA